VGGVDANNGDLEAQMEPWRPAYRPVVADSHQFEENLKRIWIQILIKIKEGTGSGSALM
jgi:hypothetical protein